MNMAEYTQCQLKDERAARYSQNTAGINTWTVIKSADSDSLKNIPIILQSVSIAQYVWGISRPYLQGKCTRERNEAVELNIETM